jgi:hypothetical protein
VAPGGAADGRDRLSVVIRGALQSGILGETRVGLVEAECFTWNIPWGQRRAMFHVKHSLCPSSRAVSRETLALSFDPQCFT